MRFIVSAHRMRIGLSDPHPTEVSLFFVFHPIFAQSNSSRCFAFFSKDEHEVPKMIDMSAEELLSFAEAARALPGHPHMSTLYRWRMKGVRGVRLESVLVGGRRFTSREALERFAARTTAADNTESVPLRAPDNGRAQLTARNTS